MTFDRMRSGMKWIMRGVVLQLKPLWTRCNELLLNVQTEPLRPTAVRSTNPTTRPWWLGDVSDKAKYNDNKAFATVDYWYIRKVAARLKCGPQDVVYDLGSGTGRILCVLAREHVVKCVGIELFQPLCEIARVNAARLRGRRSPIEIVCDDAAKADLCAGTVYFMFNPFGPDTMREVIGNIRRSLLSNPRALKLVYYNTIHSAVLSAEGWLEEYDHFYTAGGLRVAFWRNRLSC